MTRLRRAGACALAALALGEARAASVGERPTAPPSPFRILGSRLLATPPLEPFGFCASPELEGDLAQAARLAAIGELDLADQRIARSLAETPPPAGARALRAALRGRRGTTRPERRAAAAELRAAIRHDPAGPARACAWLELSRLELGLARAPEAAADALRAEAELGEASDPSFRDAARFARAEAYAAAGDREAAEALQRELVDSDHPRIASAAALRLADLRFDVGQRGELAREYERWAIGYFGTSASASVWGPRVAEVLIAAGQLEPALTWLEGHARAPEAATAAAAAVREADVLWLLGRRDAARARLEEIASDAAGRLARLREIALGLSQAAADEQLAALVRGTHDPLPGLAIYARGLLAARYTEQGQLDPALREVRRLVFAEAGEDLVPTLSADLQRVVERAASEARDDADCPKLVTRLGSGATALIESSLGFEPFVRLGECYSTLALPDLEIAVYRALVREFGIRAAERVNLPLALASLEVGDRSVARASAEASLRQPDLTAEAAGEWALLLARIERREAKPLRAIELLRPFVERGEPVRGRARAIAELARAAYEAKLGGELRGLLGQALRSLPDAERAEAPLELGEAALLAAEFHRASGEPSAARELYALASEVLDSGALLAQAGFWQGELERDEVEARRAWRRAAELGAGPFARLSAGELRMMDIRARLGRDPLPPAVAAEGG